TLSQVAVRMAIFPRFPHALSEAITEYEPEALKKAMRRAGVIHDMKRRLAILEELRLIDEKEDNSQKQKYIRELIVRSKCRRKSGKKQQRAQCRKIKRQKAIERDRIMRPSEEVVSYQSIKQKAKKSKRRHQRRKLCGYVV
ncbi:unnamed protein product, partial [Allacma fusca]